VPLRFEKLFCKNKQRFDKLSPQALQAKRLKDLDKNDV
jgi:hypothetical protein